MTYSTNHSTISQIIEHFEACEAKFLKSLKSKVNLNEYATKLYERSTRYEIYDITGGGGGELLIALAAVYINPKSLYLTNISVIKDFMYQGLGTRLMDMILQSNQGKIIELEVDFYNKNAFKFYEKYNFKVTSLKMKRSCN